MTRLADANRVKDLLENLQSVEVGRSVVVTVVGGTELNELED